MMRPEDDDNLIFPLLYQDDSIIVLDKPHGLFVHKNSFEPDAPNCVDILEKSGLERPFTVHRLDRGTSGLLVFARTRDTASSLCEQFRDGNVSKRYLALVRGHIDERIEISEPVKDKSKGVWYPARSNITPIACTILHESSGKYDESWYALVEVELLTGRRHQARSHLAGISRPVIGDTVHGDTVQNRFFRNRFGSTLMYLRSMYISFRHPGTEKTIEFHADVPEKWRTMLTTLGFDASVLSGPA